MSVRGKCQTSLLDTKNHHRSLHQPIKSLDQNHVLDVSQCGWRTVARGPQARLSLQCINLGIVKQYFWQAFCLNWCCRLHSNGLHHTDLLALIVVFQAFHLLFTKCCALFNTSQSGACSQSLTTNKMEPVPWQERMNSVKCVFKS